MEAMHNGVYYRVYRGKLTPMFLMVKDALVVGAFLDMVKSIFLQLAGGAGVGCAMD